MGHFYQQDKKDEVWLIRVRFLDFFLTLEPRPGFCGKEKKINKIPAKNVLCSVIFYP